MATTRNCLECGEPLRGRADKKFCDDQCRSQFNNKANSDVNSQMRNINNILRRNRRILERILASGTTARLPESKLTDKGYNMKYHTHTYSTRDKHTYVFCYEYGFRPIENNSVLVVKWKKEWVH